MENVLARPQVPRHGRMSHLLEETARQTFDAFCQEAEASMILAPEIQGSIPIQSSADHFMDAFRRRVASGLLTGRPHPRSNYVVAESAPDRLRVVAADWWTAMNVGLNEVELRPERPRLVNEIDTPAPVAGGSIADTSLDRRLDVTGR